MPLWFVREQRRDIFGDSLIYGRFIWFGCIFFFCFVLVFVCFFISSSSSFFCSAMVWDLCKLIWYLRPIIVRLNYCQSGMSKIASRLKNLFMTRHGWSIQFCCGPNEKAHCLCDFLVCTHLFRSVCVCLRVAFSHSHIRVAFAYLFLFFSVVGILLIWHLSYWQFRCFEFSHKPFRNSLEIVIVDLF